MKYRNSISGILIIVLPIIALIPLVQTAWDWYDVARVLDDTSLASSPRSFDWVVWNEVDGPIVADHVFPAGPAYRAGIREGDVFFSLDGLQLFNASDLQQAVEGVPPGNSVRYTLMRENLPFDAEVQLTRYPTFLYPNSRLIWRFAIWGFAVGAFIHLLGLISAAPLRRKSKPALFSFMLILVSAFWIVGNLLRILSIEFVGPPQEGTAYATIFQVVTSIALIGWIVFPVLLVRKVVGRAPSEWSLPALPRYYMVMYLPTIILACLALIAIATGGIGPINLDELVSPILFYASVYIALAAAIMLIHLSGRNESVNSFQARSDWHITGSFLTLVVAIAAALIILGIVPLLGEGDQYLASWFVVSAQLLSIAPVALVSHSTLRYGNIDHLIYRAVAYASAIGLLFILFVAGMGLIERIAGPLGSSRNIIGGLLVVGLIVLAERLFRIYGDKIQNFVRSDRRHSARLIGEFQEKARTLANKDVFVREAIELVSETFGARSGIMSLFDPVSQHWILSTYRPEAPYITEGFIRKLFPSFERDPSIWCANRELDESSLDPDLRQELNLHKASVVIPIRGSDKTMGLIVLGDKQRNRAVYNITDIDRLRWFASQLALAIERLRLEDRQKELVRETAAAQMVALRAQINPHFLFNALNTVIALISENPRKAETVVENLATIFRHTLATENQPFVTLESEIELVKNYISIEQARFGDKLDFIVQIEDGVEAHLVPAFAIQTLTENAVKHGIERKLGGGTINIEAKEAQDNDGILITVVDDGVGIPALASQNTETSFFGIGLKNISSRIEQLYGRTDLLRIESPAIGGTKATIHIPNKVDLKNN